MECLTPFQLKDQDITVPCGRCPSCTARRVSQWSFRLIQQGKIADSSHFITLTYDTQHVPISDRGFMQVQKHDLQLFFKRLRKSYAKDYARDRDVPKIKYYAVAEYGGKTKRPHYHAILFNADCSRIDPAWGLGEIHYGDVNGASIGYTLKYMNKGKWRPDHQNDDRNAPFTLMSKGLGANYLTPNMVSWHHADKLNRMYCNLTDGRKIAMPRYYKNKIYEEDERLIIGHHQRTQAVAHQAKEIDKIGIDEYEAQKQRTFIAAFHSMGLRSARGERL